MPEPAGPHPDSVRPLTAADFARFRQLAYERFGLDLRAGKEELVAARLRKVIRRLGLGSFRQYYDYVVADASGQALVELIDALTTNHTSFLREKPHFEFLANRLLPGWSRQPKIRIWSAACSTGQEPYSIAFVILNALGLEAASRLQILATDISTRVLAAAERAIYPAEDFKDVPPDWLPRFLLRGQGRWSGSFRVKPEVQRTVTFRRLNLMEPFHHHELFDLIFCRNVMIYFDRQTQARLVNRLAGCLAPGAYLFTGHAESLTGFESPFEYIQPAVYRLKGGQAARSLPSERTRPGGGR